MTRRAAGPAGRRAAASLRDDVRRMLLLVPEAWRAGPDGLPIEAAMRITGAQAAREIEDLVASFGLFELGPALPEDVVAVGIENGRVVADRALRLATRPVLSLRGGAALLAALRPLAARGGAVAASALRKLEDAIPAPFREAAERLARGLDVDEEASGRQARMLAYAVERRLEVVLRIRCEASGAVEERRVEPHALFTQGGRWYLAGWSVAAGESRAYRLDRVLDVAVGTRPCGEPGGGAPAARGGEGLRDFDPGQDRPVTLRFRGAAAERALQRWHHAVREEDGSVTVTARLPPGVDLPGWILGHGGEADVAEPPEAREALARRAADLARLYAE